MNVEKVIDDVGTGIEHLHSLRYSHNDICPFNILMKEDGTATIIDFESCRPVGETLAKRGNDSFFNEEADAASEVDPVSAFENDWYGLRRTREWFIKCVATLRASIDAIERQRRLSMFSAR